MKATEARSKAEDVLRTQALIDGTEVRQLIAKAVERGLFKCHINKSLPQAVHDHLTSEGYSVKHTFDRNEDLTTIGW